jgi:hypothetical protein
MAVLLGAVSLARALAPPGGHDHGRDPARSLANRNVGSLSHGGGLVARNREGQHFQQESVNVT